MLTRIQRQPDGRKVIVVLDTIEKFANIPVGEELRENQKDTPVIYLGVCTNESVFIQVKENGNVLIYKIDNGAVLEYTPGQPAQVEMKLNRLVNGEALGSQGGSHVGALYDFWVTWSKTGENTDLGVLITEIIRPERSSGWFAQSEARQQEILMKMTPTSSMQDFLGISSSKSTTSAFSTEVASNTVSNAQSASVSSQGEWVGFQYFEYLDEDGSRKPIPASGFCITKKLENGKLSVKKEGVSQQGFQAGKADNTNYVI